MVARKVEDSTLLQLLEQTQSPTEISRITGLAVRNVSLRLRQLGIPPLQRANSGTGTAGRDKPGRLTYNIDTGYILIGSDAHYHPGVITTAHKAFVKFCRDLKPSMVILNGDIFDGAAISRHPRTMWEDRPSVMQELKAVQERLEEIEKAARGAIKVRTIGNHCLRFESFLSAHAGQYEGVPGFTLKEHLPLWAEGWSVWINDEIVVKHRMKGGNNATYNNTLYSGKTIVTGHLHSQRVSAHTDLANQTRWGVDCGTMADPDGPQFGYTEDGVINWRSGFVVLRIESGRLLCPQPVLVVGDGLVDYCNRLYEV